MNKDIGAVEYWSDGELGFPITPELHHSSAPQG